MLGPIVTVPFAWTNSFVSLATPPEIELQSQSLSSSGVLPFKTTPPDSFLECVRVAK